MAQVYSLSQKKIIEVPDGQGQGVTQSQTSTLSPDTKTQTFPQEPIVGNPESPYKGMDIQNPGFSKPEQPKYVTGRSLEEHLQALQAAQAEGNTKAAKQIEEDFTREYNYQKDFGKKGGETKLTQEEIDAGVGSNDSIATRNTKLIENTKQGYVSAIRDLRLEGTSQAEVEKSVKEKSGGAIPKLWREAIDEAYTSSDAEPKKKGWVPDWMPFVGGF